MTQVHASNHPLLLHKLTILRDKNTDPRKFRELVREISALLTYEATADLATTAKEVTSPMGSAKGTEIKENCGKYNMTHTIIKAAIEAIKMGRQRRSMKSENKPQQGPPIAQPKKIMALALAACILDKPRACSR